VSVEAAEYPVEAGNFNSSSYAGIDGGFSGSTLIAPVVDGEALAAEEGDITAETQVIGDVELNERGAGACGGVGLGGR